MLVSICTTLSGENNIVFETEITSTKELLNYIKHTYGEKVSDFITYKPHCFVGLAGEQAITLTAESLLNDLPLYQQLYIVPAIEGNEPISAATVTATAASAAGAAGGASAAAAVSAAMSTVIIGSITVAGVVASIINTAIVIGISMAMSAIMSPDSTFTGDPSKNQKTSKMFNTAQTINEQGGSVPLIYGNPFCGGTLISSGLTSDLVTVTAV